MLLFIIVSLPITRCFRTETTYCTRKVNVTFVAHEPRTVSWYSNVIVKVPSGLAKKYTDKMCRNDLTVGLTKGSYTEKLQ